jgi:hypothetical protein
MAAEDEVRQASDRFYAALNRGISGDAGPMNAVWAHSADVTTMHRSESGKSAGSRCGPRGNRQPPLSVGGRFG